MKKILVSIFVILLFSVGIYYLNSKDIVNNLVSIEDNSLVIKFNNYEKVDDSPLYRAIKAGNITYIKSYVDSGKNLNIVDKYGVPALFYAKKDLNTLKFLINNGADINIRDKDSDSIICQVEHYLENKEILRYLFTNGIDINEPGCLFKTPPIFRAQDVDTMRLFIKLGANVNYITKEEKKTLLNTTLATSHLISYSVTKLLLENGFTKETLNVQQKYTKYSVLHGADRCLFCDKNYKDGNKNIELLIKAGANIEAKDKEGRTPIFTVGDSAKKTLIKHGADISVITKKNQNLLFYVDELALYKELINKGLDISLVNSYGETTLHHSSKETIDYIIQYVDIEKAANDGRTPLFFCYYNDEKLKKLLKYKPKINTQDNYGNTALIKYVDGGSGSNVKLLLEHGADINIKNKEGKTALNYARNKQLKNLLLEYGAI